MDSIRHGLPPPPWQPAEGRTVKNGPSGPSLWVGPDRRARREFCAYLVVPVQHLLNFAFLPYIVTPWLS